MKEYILLLFIALVGLFGLFTIHHELQVSHASNSGHYDVQALPVFPAVVQVSQENLSRLVIEDMTNSEKIVVKINHFEPGASYVLDSGCGTKTKVSSPECLLRYDRCGIFLVTLLKNNILVDAIEVTVGDPDLQTSDKLVRF